MAYLLGAEMLEAGLEMKGVVADFQFVENFRRRFVLKC